MNPERQPTNNPESIQPQRPIEITPSIQIPQPAQTKEESLRDSERAREVGIINNRPKGPDTERPVYNVEELKDKDKLTYQDVKEYVEQDQQELGQVGQEIEKIVGDKVSAPEAQRLVFLYMAELYSDGIYEALNKKSDEEAYQKRQEFDKAYAINQTLFRRFFPDKKAEVEVDRLRKELKQIQEEAKKRPVVDRSKTYWVDDASTENRQKYPAKDLVLIYNDNQNIARALRLNLIQLDLAKRGVYYEGEPTDNTYNEKPTNRTWDQAAYPQSPLHFYQEHMSAWVQQNPDKAKELLEKAKQLP